MRPSPGKVVTGEVVSGRGRIIFYNSFRPQGFLFREAYETDSQFPFDMHANAWLARLCHYAAGAIERGFSACGVLFCISDAFGCDDRGKERMTRP